MHQLLERNAYKLLHYQNHFFLKKKKLQNYKYFAVVKMILEAGTLDQCH